MSLTLTWERETTRARPEGGDDLIIESGSLVCDIVTSETWDVGADVTSQVVEEGTPITDHIRPQQSRATFEVWVSESPVLTSLVEGAEHRDLELPSGGSASVLQVPDGTTRGADALRTLEMLCTRGFLVDIDGARIPIVGWALQSVSMPRDPDASGAFSALITAVEVRTAEFETVSAPSPRVERGRSRSSEGRESPEDGSDDDASNDPANREQSVSVLHEALSGALGNLTGTAG